MEVTPIGIFRCPETYTYDAARQGTLAPRNSGTIALHPGQNFEQALRELEGFSHIWLLFQFHQNEHWKPVVKPPRGNRKVGVFASRGPYRPNGIGMSCVQLVHVEGRHVEVAGHDLLDGTPILDIKPYIPYADCIPEATGGWTDEIAEGAWTVVLSECAREQLAWLADRGVDCIEAFLRQQLGDEPFDQDRKRVRSQGDGRWELAYRTWRASFRKPGPEDRLEVTHVYSGYSPAERASEDDPYHDKDVHRAFVANFEGEDGTSH